MKIFNNHGIKNLPRQINHLKSAVIISTKKYLSLLNKGHNNNSNLAMKIFNNHGRKNSPRQINHLKSPVIIRSFDHSKNERKKLTLRKLQNMDSHYCLEHLKR